MTMNTKILLEELSQFTGTEQWYRNPLFRNYVYTDGVKYLAEKAGAYWLIDYIFSNQLTPKIRKEEFQNWKVKTNNNSAIIRVEDGRDNLIQKFKLEYTDFPFEEFNLWFTDNTLLLPSEY